MNDIQFFQTKMGRQFFAEMMPELVRETHCLNDLLALAIEAKGTEPKSKAPRDDRSSQN